MLHHIVIAILVVTLPFAHPQSFWSSISTCFLPCEQSLAVAQGLGPSSELLLDPVCHQPPAIHHGSSNSQQWGAQVVLSIIIISSHCCCPVVPISAHFVVVLSLSLLLSWFFYYCCPLLSSSYPPWFVVKHLQSTLQAGACSSVWWVLGQLLVLLSLSAVLFSNK